MLVAALLVLPAAIEVSRRSKAVSVLEAGYAIPLAFLLGLLSAGPVSTAVSCAR